MTTFANMRIKNISASNFILRSKLPLVIGYFGSLHVMHNQILDNYYDFNILTFRDFEPKSQNQIFGFGEKIRRLKAYNPVNIYVYDVKNGNITAEEFIQKVLMKIKPTEILVGSDFTFGSDKKDWTYLRKFFNVRTLTYNPAVSTTNIANLLRKHKVQEANNFLMEPYSYTSEWVKGFSRGRKLGRKTVNLKNNGKLLIPHGIYTTLITIGNKTYNSITFYGIPKTFNLVTPTIETHILNENIAPRFLQPFWKIKNVKITFLDYIRDAEKFPNKDKLAEQINKDVAKANKFFETN